MSQCAGCRTLAEALLLWAVLASAAAVTCDRQISDDGALRMRMAELDHPTPVSQPPILPPNTAALEDGSRAAHALVSNLVVTTIDKAMLRIQESIMDAVEAKMMGAFQEQQQALTHLSFSRPAQEPQLVRPLSQMLVWLLPPSLHR